MSDSLREWCGTMETLMEEKAVFRRISSVGNRVHKLLFTGKETLEILSNTELSPEDWSPHTII